MGGWGWVGDLSHCDSSPVTAAGLPNITPQPPFQHLLSSFEQSSTSFSKSFPVLYPPLFFSGGKQATMRGGQSGRWLEVGWGWLEWIHLDMKSHCILKLCETIFEVTHVELQADIFNISALSFHKSWNSICSVACLEVRQWNFIGGAAAYVANTWNTWTVQALIAQHRMLLTLAPQHLLASTLVNTWDDGEWHFVANNFFGDQIFCVTLLGILVFISSQVWNSWMNEALDWTKHFECSAQGVGGATDDMEWWTANKQFTHLNTHQQTNNHAWPSLVAGPAGADHIIRETLSRVIFNTHNPHPNKAAQLRNYKTYLRSLSRSINSSYKISGNVLAARKITIFGKIKMMKMLMMTRGLTLCPAGGSLNVWTLNTPCWLSQM